jgi:hypothetical protein
MMDVFDAFFPYNHDFIIFYLFHSVLRAETAAICAVSTTAAAIDYLSHTVNDGQAVAGQ